MASYFDPDFEAAKARLEQRRSASLTRQQQNVAVAYARFPRLKEINDEMKRLFAQAGEMMRMAPGPERDAFSAKLRAEGDILTKEKEAILADNGLPKDYLQRQYTCKKCGDTGQTVEGTCECMKLLMKQARFERINNISGIRLADFDSFDLNFYSKQSQDGNASDYQIMQGNLTYCKNYAETFNPQTAKNLLMIGGTGLGKTHLSLAIARSVIERGYQVVYGSMQELMSAMEKEQFDYDSEEITLDSLKTCDLLILDDLGTEFITQFSTACMYTLINGRINAGLPTIINTNLSYKELEEIYTPRICSRIMGTYQEIAFYGDDIRIQKNNG